MINIWHCPVLFTYTLYLAHLFYKQLNFVCLYTSPGHLSFLGKDADRPYKMSLKFTRHYI
jgi:hypothetical protein